MVLIRFICTLILLSSLLSCNSYRTIDKNGDILPKASADSVRGFSERVGLDTSGSFFIPTSGLVCASIPEIIIKQLKENSRSISLKYNVRYRIQRTYDAVTDSIIFEDIDCNNEYQLYVCRLENVGGHNRYRIMTSLNDFTAKTLQVNKKDSFYFVLYVPTLKYGSLYNNSEIFTYYKHKEYVNTEAFSE